jgi:Mu transposase, C-terminal
MMNSDSKPHQNQEIGCIESVHRKVYRHGVVRFSQMSYEGECLKNYEGRDVILLFDPDRILEMRTYAQTDNGTPGEFLGYIKMINFEGLGLSQCQEITSHF